MIEAPYPGLNNLLTMMGDAGLRMSEIGACEGAAGNISICLRWPMELNDLFPEESEIELTQPAPKLAGATLLVSGSGTRFREIKDDPTANIACITINHGGQNGRLYTSHHRRFERVTSEFNSHLAVHYNQMVASGTNFHAIIHAQPVYLTLLGHIPRYQNEQVLNTHLMRWQPETIINLPEGIGFIPFCLPGSAELMAANVENLRYHRIVVWAKHGVMARSDVSVKLVADWIEYAETAAKYEYLNLAIGEMAEGLSVEEIRSICKALNLKQRFF